MAPSGSRSAEPGCCATAAGCGRWIWFRSWGAQSSSWTTSPAWCSNCTGPEPPGRLYPVVHGIARRRDVIVAWLWIIIGVVALVVILGIVSYNRFVSGRQLIRDSWANIDTELRRRYDLIPNLVETVKGYAAHERGVFEEVARTRSAAAAATGTPQQLANTEDRIQASRRFYNNNVQSYNARIKQFPSMFIARMGGFTEEQFFEVEEAIRQAGAPRVDFGTAEVPAAGPAPESPPSPPA